MEADYDSNGGLTVSWDYLPGVQTDGGVQGVDGSVIFARAERHQYVQFCA